MVIYHYTFCTQDKSLICLVQLWHWRCNSKHRSFWSHPSHSAAFETHPELNQVPIHYLRIERVFRPKKFLPPLTFCATNGTLNYCAAGPLVDHNKNANCGIFIMKYAIFSIEILRLIFELLRDFSQNGLTIPYGVFCGGLCGPMILNKENMNYCWSKDENNELPSKAICLCLPIITIYQFGPFFFYLKKTLLKKQTIFWETRFS